MIIKKKVVKKLDCSGLIKDSKGKELVVTRKCISTPSTLPYIAYLTRAKLHCMTCVITYFWVLPNYISFPSSKKKKQQNTEIVPF